MSPPVLLGLPSTLTGNVPPHTPVGLPLPSTRTTRLRASPGEDVPPRPGSPTLRPKHSCSRFRLWASGPLSSTSS